MVTYPRVIGVISGSLIDMYWHLVGWNNMPMSSAFCFNRNNFRSMAWRDVASTTVSSISSIICVLPSQSSCPKLLTASIVGSTYDVNSLQLELPPCLTPFDVSKVSFPISQIADMEFLRASKNVVPHPNCSRCSNSVLRFTRSYAF